MDTFGTPLLVQDGKGRLFINADKVGEQYFAIPANDYPLTVTGGQKGYTAFVIPADGNGAGDTEVAMLVANATGPFTCELFEIGKDRSSYQNGPIHHNLMFGSGPLPFVLAETVMLRAGSQIQVAVNSLAGNSFDATHRLAVVGRKLNSEMRQAARVEIADALESRPYRPFWLTLDDTKVVLTANQTGAEKYMTVPSGSHFTAERLLVESTGPFEFRLYDALSGRELTNGYIDSRLLAGTGGLPGRTIGAPIIQPRRSIRVLFNDLSGASNTIYFTIHGRRLRVPIQGQ
jgi:hypothetical protein